MRDFSSASQLIGHQLSMLLAGLRPFIIIWASAFAIVVLPHWFASTGRALVIAAIPATAASACYLYLAINRSRRFLQLQEEETRRRLRNSQGRR